MTLASEQVVQDRYRIVSLLGQGGMGAVYRAWDTRLSITVAIKEMIPQSGLDPHMLAQLRQQFQQEAVVLARMHHPHLVRVTDFFEERGNAYLVMDFADGESLAHRIEQQGALPEAQVLEWAAELLEALAYCHAQGVIHRDVKPQNVIIRPDGQATLVDFGLVKLWDAHDPRTRTAMRGLGTPEYAPPEQYDDTHMGHTGPHSDIYSLGATLYHALTGQAPPTATMRIANPDKLRPPRAVNPRISLRTEAVVLRATQLAVGNRFATAQEMARALRGRVLAPTRPVALAPAAAQDVPATHPILPDRRRRVPAWGWVLGGAVGLALVAGLVGAVLIARSGIGRGGNAGASTPTPQVEETAAGAAPAGAGEPATPLVSPSATRTPTRTSTPTRMPTRETSPTGTPTGTPRGTPKGRSAPTSAPTVPTAATSTLGPQTPTPEPTSPPASGAVFSFEQWATWQRGDQPYGELTQTQEQVRSGRYAAKLVYDFPATDEDYVVFVRSLSLVGRPNTIGGWVYGDGSGHYLNVWVQDAQNEIWAIHLGRVGGSGWRQMVGTLDASLSWPSGHVSGPSNGVIDYPVRFYALVLDRPGSGPRGGQLYIDDLSVWRSTTSATATPPPGATATSAIGGSTPTATAESPASAGPLYFAEPTRLDTWRAAEGGHEATIILHISGGVPPFTIYHDMDKFVTEEREYALVFTASGCNIIHSITMQSADGQSVSHDYFIRSPWCD